MTHTSRLLLVASVCSLAVLYSGVAFALPHSRDFKGGKSGWNERSYDHDRFKDEGNWGEKDDKQVWHKFKKFDWDDHEPKHDWFSWGYGKKDDKWYGGKDWGKDPDCDPPLTHTPEPATLLLLGSSLAAAGVAWRKRRRAEKIALEP